MGLWKGRKLKVKQPHAGNTPCDTSSQRIRAVARSHGEENARVEGGGEQWEESRLTLSSTETKHGIRAGPRASQAGVWRACPDLRFWEKGVSPPRAEEQVARDTEEVFRSYVFYRHRQEQESEEVAAPADPEMDSLPLEPNSTMGQVGRQLAIIGDDINRRYDSEFQAMLQQLQPTAENAYEYFTKIASSLFESGINWGRVVALLGFGYRLALHVYQRGLRGFLGQVARFVADFMLRHCIARWIAQRGGWVAALDLGNGPIRNVLMVLGVVLLGQFVVRRFFKS
ncbi:Bcl-2 homologous antagonist/killer [Tupaia chinensis]|uniref:Bcl-2 homologous antagonist/killer n=1 Tax=Tupaia chinensis TaxID=246437 RepID=L9L3A9_TUPCH|nr:Bcl-2 homologous antagonist/killer [Tupaia chinensis]